MDEVKRLLASVLAVLWLLVAVAPPVGAAQTLDVEASIDGRDLAEATSDDPVAIDPNREIPLSVTIRNAGNQTESIRFVRLEGEALGLTFLTYDLGIRTQLRPGETTTVEAALDFFDLEDQATGYLGASLRVYDDDRRLLGEQRFVMDIEGKVTSTLGLFALAVLGIAGFSVTTLVLNTLRRRLPANRFVRGLQFGVAGGAIGVTLALGVSILRISFADVEQWVPLVFLPTVIAFAVGYVAPGPLSQSIREVREEEALLAVAEAAVARATGSHAPAIPDSQHPDGPRTGAPERELTRP
ncbi:MAG TPA: hypothetical protein VFU14_13460 [Acidimicrobiales bacterium]|nr:hypothetical protein [Acidimicrobiales bacterium]